MVDAYSIGRKIAKIRKREGLSQQGLGLRLSISPQAISKWECGDSLPDLLTIDTLCHLFDLEPNYFFQDEEKDRELFAVSHMSHMLENIDDSTVIKSDISNYRVINPHELGIKKFESITSPTSIWKNISFIDNKTSNFTFHGQIFNSCRFDGCDMQEALFSGDVITTSSFDLANLQDASFKYSIIQECTFLNATLQNTLFKGDLISEIIFEKVTCQGCVFHVNAITNFEFKDGLIENSTFKKCRLKNVRFHTNLDTCNFTNTTFVRCVFENIKITSTTFVGNKKAFKNLRIVNCELDQQTYKNLLSLDVKLDSVTII
jgi:transcriptional regulator with XRE-family HTH domain